jgi:hypothetical protein
MVYSYELIDLQCWMNIPNAADDTMTKCGNIKLILERYKDCQNTLPSQ